MVSPCPGKCLPQEATPPASSPRPSATPSRATSSASRVKRAVADDRVGRVGVHVEHRREVPVEAHRAQLVREQPAHALGERLVAALAQLAHGGQGGERRAAQARHAAALLVHREEEGPARVAS